MTELPFDGIMAATMTKEELRSALTDAGVSSPSSARKDELLALYDSVQMSAGGVDFSADDEEEVALATLKKTKKVINKVETTAEDSMVLGDFDVSQLTDDQLCEALIERQIQVGPIVGKPSHFSLKYLPKLECNASTAK